MEESKIDKMIGKWTFDSLYEYFSKWINESDLRYSQRFDAQQKAIDKSDAAAEKRFQSVNEFRASLSDQNKTFMPRSEAEARAHSNADKIDVLASRMDKLETRLASKEEIKDDKMAAVARIVQIVVGLLTIFAIVIGVAFFINKSN